MFLHTVGRPNRTSQTETLLLPEANVSRFAYHMSPAPLATVFFTGEVYHRELISSQPPTRIQP